MVPGPWPPDPQDSTAGETGKGTHETGAVERVVPAGDADEDIREFYLGLSEEGHDEKSLRDVKHYRRKKRWLA